MVNQMAWAVGEILQTLKELAIDNDTLVIFTSDNGPAVDLCLDGGNSGHFSGFPLSFTLLFNSNAIND